MSFSLFFASLDFNEIGETELKYYKLFLLSKLGEINFILLDLFSGEDDTERVFLELIVFCFFKDLTRLNYFIIEEKKKLFY